MISDRVEFVALASITILVACLFAAWRKTGPSGKSLGHNLVRAIAGASVLNLALAALWFMPQTLGGPGIFILAIGLPYLFALMITRD